MLGPTLHTDRLILRLPERADFDAYAEQLADPSVMEHLGGAQPRPVAWRGFLQYAGAWALGEPSMFFVIERSSGRFIGRIGPWRPEGWPGDEVGWALSRDAWGKGYALEAATACMDFAFDQLGWTEVVHSISAQNAPSQAVARRLGSTLLRQAMLPPPISHEVDVWGQTREQWRARRSSLPA